MQFTQEQEYTKRFDFGLWKQILIYARPYKKNLITLMICMGLTAVLDALYPLMTSYAIDNIIETSSLNKMPMFIVTYALMACGSTLSTYIFIKQSARIETGICYDVRMKGFKRLQELSFTFYDRTPTGYLMARMTSDVQRLADIIGWGMVDIVWAIAMIVFSCTIMFLRDWRLALLVVSVVPLLAVVSLYFQKKILAVWREVRKTNSQITGSFNEGIVGAKTTKTLVREDRNFSEFKDITARMKKSSVHASVLSAIYMPIVTAIGTLATGIALWKGGYDVFTGAMTLGTFTIFINYSMQMFEPIQNIARMFTELQSAQAAAERIVSLIETEPDIKDRDDVIEKYGDQINPKKENWEPIRGDVEFENVSFAYKGGEKVLDNFNLKIKAGQTIALVGETGSGKSTIVNLVCRFYEPTEGSLKIDGVDYRERSQLWLQSDLGYVLQSPHLFSGTVADNIRYGRFDATDEEVIRAAKLVDADKFITKLEKGYNTDVGEGGSRLSTGEKQLVSFARALLANPAIFVLDEATSSIDTETEMLIQKAINQVLTGRTSFIVAHRLSTIRNADRILCINGGKIIEDGTHAELIKKRGYYYNLYTNQFYEEQTRAAMQQ